MGNTAATTGPLLVVRAGGRRLGLPARLVRRVVRQLTVYPIPGSAPRFAGLAQLGGEPVPVVDLAVEIGTAEPTAAPTRLAVVVEIAGAGGPVPLALAVDDAVDIVTGRDGTQDGGEASGRPGLEIFDPSRLVHVG